MEQARLYGAYTEDELKGFVQGFGHGSPRGCVDQAVAANAKRLIIHHHDPKHNDRKVTEMELDAIEYGRTLNRNLVVEMAREGFSGEI